MRSAHMPLREGTMTCSSCHETIAIDEASPEILKTLGLAG